MKTISASIIEQSPVPKKYKPYIIYSIIFVVALLLRLIVAFLIHQPGYIDAYYYYEVAVNFHTGKGLTSTSLWNYQLDSFVPLNNSQLVHPAFSYWLPLATFLIIASFSIFGVSFLAAQIPFILIASVLPPVAFWLGQLTFGTKQKRYSWAMALVMLFPGRYFLFFNTPDNFAPFALLILLGLIFTYIGVWQGKSWAVVLVGFLSGLAYLSRSDGLLLLLTLIFCFMWRRWQLRTETEKSDPDADSKISQDNQPYSTWVSLGGAILVTLATIIPWLWRNLETFGTIFPTVGSKVLFMRDYQELFSFKLNLGLDYYVNQTSPSQNWGIGPLLFTKFTAIWLDLLILAVQGLFLLGPLFLAGLFLIKKRSLPNRYSPFLIYFCLFYLAMVFVFTLVGEHGTIFHSAGGLLPFQVGAASTCIAGLSSWYARKRKTNPLMLEISLLSLFLGLNIILTIYIGFTEWQKWDDDYHYSQEIGEWFQQNNLDTNAIMISEPLSYAYANGKFSIPIASDGIEANVEAAHKYGANWLALGQVHYNSLDNLYNQKAGNNLVWVTTLSNGTEIFRIE